MVKHQARTRSRPAEATVPFARTLTTRRQCFTVSTYSARSASLPGLTGTQPVPCAGTLSRPVTHSSITNQSFAEPRCQRTQAGETELLVSSFNFSNQQRNIYVCISRVYNDVILVTTLDDFFVFEHFNAKIIQNFIPDHTRYKL